MNELLKNLENKITQFQSRIVLSQDERNKYERQGYESERKLYLELFDMLDAFDRVMHKIEPKLPELEKSIFRSFMSIEAIRGQIMSILERRGITQIQFPENKIIVGYCRIVETIKDPAKDNDTIVHIQKHGYIRGTEVLRQAELIIVKNDN